MDHDKLMQLLVEVTGSTQVLRQPNIRLFDAQLLDSIRLVDLFLAIEESFGITISPADFDREAWATPEAFVRDMMARAATAP
ncbi:MAG: D-alanine--poly(phosphoribitol) ligase subunit 2 [Verrucomicrobiaceae bacterium]|nr:D-alanine--poly(phosphoribitol) ligase subunit 2 [Verrucomicrobiaceae bacterium]